LKTKAEEVSLKRDLQVLPEQYWFPLPSKWMETLLIPKKRARNSSIAPSGKPESSCRLSAWVHMMPQVLPTLRSMPESYTLIPLQRPRDSFVIGTSIGMWQFRQADQVKKTITQKTLQDYIEGSLQRLDLDYIDIYYLGGIQHKEIVEYEPYLEVLKEYKKAGRLRFLGVTTHSNEPEIIRTATDGGIYDVVLTAYNFRKNNRDEIKKAVAYAASKGMGIVAMKTQAGVYWDGKEKKQMINMKAALKWALQDENIHTAIPSFKNSDQLYEALSVMENLELTPQEKADLKLDQSNSSTGLFCSQCNECLPQCPADLDIPTLMRSYMYAYGYESPAKARETLDFIDLSNIPCINCETCRVTCSSGFDVKRKVIDIARLKDVPKEFLVV